MQQLHLFSSSHPLASNFPLEFQTHSLVGTKNVGMIPREYDWGGGLFECHSDHVSKTGLMPALEIKLLSPRCFEGNSKIFPAVSLQNRKNWVFIFSYNT